MELVRGLPITEDDDSRKFATAERLTLFVKVCQAAQHAHQKGVIHRDLKPSNVLVTMIDGEAVPKVIDFGVAKAVGLRSSSALPRSLAGSAQSRATHTSKHMISRQHSPLDLALGHGFQELRHAGVCHRSPAD